MIIPNILENRSHVPNRQIAFFCCAGDPVTLQTVEMWRENRCENPPNVFAERLFQKLWQHVFCLAHLPLSIDLGPQTRFGSYSIYSTIGYHVLSHIHTIYIAYTIPYTYYILSQILQHTLSHTLFHIHMSYVGT